jgi:hypothetical protein
MLRPADTLRLAREKRFQDRVLAALEKPRKNRILLIINSAFFLWLLSASVLTFGSFYFTTYQQCVRDANSDSDKYFRLAREVFNRKEYVASVVAKTKSFSELIKYLKPLPYVYVDFKDRSLFDLQRELNKIEIKIDKADIRGWILQTGAGYEGIAVNDRDLRQYQSILNGEVGSGIGDDEYLVLNDFIQNYYYLGHRDFRIVQTTNLSPNCSATTVLGILLGASTKIIQASHIELN